MPRSSGVVAQQAAEPQAPPLAPIETTPIDIPPKAPSKKSWKKPLLIIITSVMVVVATALAAMIFWYNAQLAPVDETSVEKRLVRIERGTNPSEIATLLEENGLIRSKVAFSWYTRIERAQNKLQAGTYRLSPSESTPEIVTHLTSGKVDTFTITFLPGATLDDHRKVLIDAGYDTGEVDTALAKTYNSPLFQDKPANASLEGYIYGETYRFATDASVEEILEYVFEQFYKVIQAHQLIDAYRSQGLTLYQGITLASIVQREASSAADDMPTIAQVFYSRLALGMQLGSDVTYQYIADKTGVARDPNLDSPYNTRRYAGLPPGPISSPGEKALLAIAHPSATEYLYFLSGDDDITYFGKTLAEHEANIVNRCQKKCQIL